MTGYTLTPPSIGKDMFDDSFGIKEFDSELASAIASEEQRQEDHIELIASEN